MKLISVFGAVLVLALFGAACGGGDGDIGVADQALVDALVAEFDAEPPPGDFDYDTNCIAEHIVSELGGAEKIEGTYGVTAAEIASGSDVGDLNLSESQALSLTDKIWSCADFAAMSMAGFAGEGISEDDASCLVDIIGEDPIKKLFASGFMGDAGDQLADSVGQEIFAVGFDAVTKCEIAVP